ncbi:MAG: plastocyanin/azurin family copper-binding protein [Gemmatimonadaceae bacterium]|nr:plastocyanin/azurin family copper-binding protein [Gemmatimonadaceae bacterium]
MRRAALTALLCAASACNDRGAAPDDAAPVARVTGPAPLATRGRIHTVRMLMDNEGFRFDPSYITVDAGDGVRFLMVSGVPHNVAFDARFIPRASRPQLVANIRALGGRDLASPVVTAIDSTFVVSTSGLPAGDYLFYCGPHRSLNMHGVLTIR